MIKNFTLGAVEWTVEEVSSALSNKMGISDSRLATIKIDKDVNLDMKEETLYHEVIHAILDSSGLHEESKNEQLVQTLAQGIYQFEKTKK